jgi:hypothetical protein
VRPVYWSVGDFWTTRMVGRKQQKKSWGYLRGREAYL